MITLHAAPRAFRAVSKEGRQLARKRAECPRRQHRYFCVRPAEVRVFTDHDYHGRSGEVRRDVGDLHGMWRDSIESIRVG